MQPLLRGDQAMEAAGRIYHPHHFGCEGCGVALSGDSEFFEHDSAPYCARCNDRMFNSCPGCRLAIAADDRDTLGALGRNWHSACFVCTHCRQPFDSNQFYAQDDGAGRLLPYCERDYMALFVPKCRACGDPVADAGIAACGASWHSACFGCTVCKNALLDGQFYNGDGRPYCKDHYFEAFGTKCAKCNEYLTDVLLQALDKKWHAGCFACAHCSKPFAEAEYYVHGGKAYCEDDYCELFCPVCPKCNCYVVEDGAVVFGETYHPWCVVCHNCNEQLEGRIRKAKDGNFYCEQDYLALFAQECAGCGGVIDDETINALDKPWHVACFKCGVAGCGEDLVAVGRFHNHEGKPYCREHFAHVAGKPCAACGKGILPGSEVTLLGKPWHAECIACAACRKPLSTQDKIYKSKQETPLCASCFEDTCEKCTACRKALLGKYLTVLTRKYHPEGCLGCGACGKPFGPDDKMYQREGWPVCSDHARGELSDEARARMGLGAAGGAGGGAAAPPPS
jgi:paxillin